MTKKHYLIIIGALAAAVALTVSQLLPASLPTGAWGLSFSQEGQTPSGPADSDTLRQYAAAYVGDPSEQVLYLTFDAGYENGYTSGILDTLKKHQVSAAFFLVGDYLERNPDLVRRMVDEGHIVGNHTASHPDMSKLRELSAFENELQQVEVLFRDITGKELPKYYRPPQGIYSQQNLEQAKLLGYRTVFWSLAYADWDNHNQPSREYALEKLLPRTHNGAVILLHATSQTNAQILDELITAWKAQGYQFASIDRLFLSS